MKFDEGWVKFFADELAKSYFRELAETVQKNRDDGRKVYPLQGHIFEAFARSPFSDLKVVIVGGDPYPQEGFATGLAYSLPNEAPPTKELKNIHTEMSNTFKGKVPFEVNLSKWAEGGILLLNNVLTVEAEKPKSHRGLGWEQFTQNCLKYTSDNKDERIVFCLWGQSAHRHAPFIDRKKHLVLKASDPSTGANGFFGCGHFIHINQATRLWE